MIFSRPRDAGGHGVNTVGQNLTISAMKFSRTRKRNLRIDAEGHSLAFFAVTIVPPPILARFVHQQKKTTTVGKFTGLSGDFGFGLAAGGRRYRLRA
jgi:hypothetical protein